MLRREGKENLAFVTKLRKVTVTFPHILRRYKAFGKL